MTSRMTDRVGAGLDHGHHPQVRVIEDVTVHHPCAWSLVKVHRDQGFFADGQINVSLSLTSGGCPATDIE